MLQLQSAFGILVLLGIAWALGENRRAVSLKQAALGLGITIATAIVLIKIPVVAHAFARQSVVEHHLIHTGQHFDENMSDIFFSELEIPTPLYSLAISGLSHGAMTGRPMRTQAAR